MNHVLTIALFTFLLLPLSAFAEIKTVTHTFKQPFGGSQSPDDARTAGIARAKREALEQFGTYIESTTIVKNSIVDSDEILALTAGVTKAEVVKQKNYMDGDAFGMEITVTVELDTAVLEKSLKRLLDDRNHLKDLKDVREREKKLLARVAELEKENLLKGKTEEKSAELKKEFNVASQGLAAVDWFRKAFALLKGQKNSDPKKSIEYLTQAIQLDPDFTLAYISRGVDYALLKQFDRAIADFDQAIRFDPNQAMTYNNRGNVYADLKQFNRAIADFDQAIRLSISTDQTLTAAYNNRGGAYIDLKQFERAVADFDQAIRLKPTFALSYNNRGIAYDRLKQYKRAIDDYDQAIRLDPKYSEAFTNRGDTHNRLKQFELAIASYDQAIRLDPNSAIAYNNRGATYADFKQLDRAMTDYDEAIRINPKDATTYYHRGNANRDLKIYDRAITDYDQAIRYNPNYTEAYYYRGFAYLMSSQNQKACPDLVKACTLGECGGFNYAQQNKLCR
jgi:tetratricopeptide (TPR) repeat protein